MKLNLRGQRTHVLDGYDFAGKLIGINPNGDLVPAEISRVESLDDTNLLCGVTLVESSGTPAYISEDDIDEYAEYGLTESGWYIFARIRAENGVHVGSGFTVTGAAGFIQPENGNNHVDVAVRFDAAAVSQTVTVTWHTNARPDMFSFRSTDLAIRNLDYRVTFYQYDLSPYCTYTWQAATGTFATGKSYYTKDGDTYTKATVTAGQSIPANTYYTHASLTISGFVKNISYMLDEIDCPVTINLPEVTDNYGAWFEVQTNFLAVYSVTLSPVSPDKVSANRVQTPKSGVNIINLMYHRPTKTWLPTLTQWGGGV